MIMSACPTSVKNTPHKGFRKKDKKKFIMNKLKNKFNKERLRNKLS